MTDSIVFDGVSDFNLDHIFDCGQAFRWSRDGERRYVGVAGRKAAAVSFSPIAGHPYNGRATVKPLGRLHAPGDPVEQAMPHMPPQPGARRHRHEEEKVFFFVYLDLKRDYGAIKRALAADDPVMGEAISFGQGIRILNQDPWEALISFIISQNNHIPRIKGCIESLCVAFGGLIGNIGGNNVFAFPDPEDFAGLEAGDLAICRLGYRAEYVVKAAKQVMGAGGREYLESLRALSFGEADKMLRKIHGVGPKVAACASLFGLGHVEGFPVDVWISRAMHELYGVDAGDRRAVAEFALGRFGAWAGVAQQYLFYYMRERAK